MAGRIQRPSRAEQYADLHYLACGPGRDRDRHDPRLEQDMDAMLEADVEYFDHPTLGRVHLRDVLVVGQDDTSIEDEQVDDLP